MRRLIGTLVVLLLVLVALDRIAWFGAEQGLARAIQESEQLARRPAVSVSGFPFLTQALAGRYERVDATLTDLTVDDGVTVERLDVRLNGVHVKLGDLIRGQVVAAPVDSASAVATVSYAALNAAAKANLASDQLDVTFGPGSGDRIAVRGTFRGGLINLKIDGQARVTAQRGRLVVGLVPDSVDGLPPFVRDQVIALLGVSYGLPPLPLGFEAKEVTVGPGGVTVRSDAASIVVGE